MERKVLVVDDDRTILIALKSHLKTFSADVDLASNGMEAITFLKKSTYDLVITDLMMPEMSGIELIKTIRLDFKLRVPILVLSSVGVDNVVMLAYELGINDFLSKPRDKKQFLDRVQKIWEGNWIRTELDL